MMKDYENQIANDLIRYGKIISDKEFSDKGHYYRQYIILFSEDKKGEYHITKCDGEIIYFERFQRTINI